MRNNYNIISSATEQVQTSLNENAGIGIKALVPEYDTNRVNGIIKHATSSPYDNIKASFLNSVVNYSQSIVDKSVEKNADFQYESGMRPTIKRTLNGVKPCAFCVKRAGTYDYPLKDREVYRRHTNCYCTVEYTPSGSKVSQDVWNKQWKTQEEIEKEQRINTARNLESETENADLRIKANNNYEQLYKPVKRGATAVFLDKYNNAIPAKQIEGYKNVFVSDNAIIKPKALHEINKNTDDALKTYGIPEEKKPKIIIASSEEMQSAWGRYDAINNEVYYAPEITSKQAGTNGVVEYHEMWHLKHAEDFRNAGWTIKEENYNQYMQELCKVSKKRLEKNGINEYNVSEISDYANVKFNYGRYDEVEAELMALKKNRI